MLDVETRPTELIIPGQKRPRELAEIAFVLVNKYGHVRQEVSLGDLWTLTADAAGQDFGNNEGEDDE